MVTHPVWVWTLDGAGPRLEIRAFGSECLKRGIDEPRSAWPHDVAHPRPRRGYGSGATVTPDYTADTRRFTGRINRVQVDLGDHDRFIGPGEASPHRHVRPPDIQPAPRANAVTSARCRTTVRHCSTRGAGFVLTEEERKRVMTQTQTPLDQLGPVDYIVVEFPAGESNFTGEMAQELLALVDSGTVRVIDILILTKAADGSVDAMELSDLDDLGPLQQIETELAELLAADDVANLAAAMEPGSTAGVLIWENLWAAPFASAARRSGGQLIADGRIPIQAIIASLEADDATTEGV